MDIRTKKFTTAFGPEWTEEMIINEIIDAIENDRIIKNPEINPYKLNKQIKLQTKTGLVIELDYNTATKNVSIYPELNSIRKTK